MNSLLYQAELTSFVEHFLAIPGIRHGSAARTGWVNEPKPLWIVRTVLRIGVSSKMPIRCACIPLPPVPKHPGTAREAPRGFPCLGPANARMLRERDAIAFDPVIPLCERQNENAPGCWTPRAFAFLGDRGDRSPVAKISRCGRNLRCAYRASGPGTCLAIRTRARMRQAFWALAGTASGCGMRWSWKSIRSGVLRGLREGCAPYGCIGQLARKNFADG